MFMVVSGRRDTARSGTDGSMYRAMKRRVRRSEPKTRRSRGRDDRGAVLVEAAFMLPFLVALLMGIIDFGFVFNDWISVRQGGRDGLREVIVNTNPTGPGAGGSWSCDLAGCPFSAEQTSTACYIKSRVGLDNTKTAVAVFFTDGSFVGGQPVKVCVQYETGSVTGAYTPILVNKVLDTEVESLIEQPPIASTTFHPLQETAFPDGHAIKTWGSLSCDTL